MGQLEINKLEKKTKKTVMPLFGVLAANLRRGTGKPRTPPPLPPVNVWVEISNSDILHTKQYCPFAVTFGPMAGRY